MKIFARERKSPKLEEHIARRTKDTVDEATKFSNVVQQTRHQTNNLKVTGGCAVEELERTPEVANNEATSNSEYSVHLSTTSFATHRTTEHTELANLYSNL